MEADDGASDEAGTWSCQSATIHLLRSSVKQTVKSHAFAKHFTEASLRISAYSSSTLLTKHQRISAHCLQRDIQRLYMWVG